jgi:hypothetical protein
MDAHALAGQVDASAELLAAEAHESRGVDRPLEFQGGVGRTQTGGGWSSRWWPTLGGSFAQESMERVDVESRWHGLEVLPVEGDVH